MDDDRRAQPRRLLSFDASQVSLSRISKALYPGRPLARSPLEENPPQLDSYVYGRGSTEYTAKGPIIAMAASPDRKQAAILSKESLDVLVVASPGVTVSNSAKVHPRYNPSALQWGPNMNIAMADSGGSLILYKLKPDGSLLSKPGQSANLHRGINSLSFSHQGPLLAAMNDGSIRMWDARQGMRRGPVSTFARSGDISREVQFRPSSDFSFAAIYDSGMVQRWDTRNPSNCDLRLNAHIQGLCLNWHPTANYLVSGGRDHLVQVWNMATEARTPEYTITTPSAVARARWVPGESQVVSSPIVTCGRSATDFAVSYWSLRRPWTPTYSFGSHTDQVSDIIPVSPHMVWSSSKDKTFVQSDLRGEPKVSDNWPPALAAWSPHNDVTISFMRSLAPPRPKPIHRPSNASGRQPSTSMASSLTQASVSSSVLDRQSPAPLAPAISPTTSNLEDLQRCVPVENPWPMPLLTLPFPATIKGTFEYSVDHFIFTRQTGQTLGEACRHNAFVVHMCRHFRTAQVWQVIAVAVDHLETQFLEQVSTQQKELARRWLRNEVAESNSADAMPSNAHLADETPTTPSGADWKASGVSFNSDISAGSEDLDENQTSGNDESVQDLVPAGSKPVLIPSRALSSTTEDVLSQEGYSSSVAPTVGSFSHLAYPKGFGLNRNASKTRKQSQRVLLTRRPTWTHGSDSAIAALRRSFEEFVLSKNESWDLLPILKRTVSHCIENGLLLSAMTIYLLFKHLPEFVNKRQIEEVIFSCIERMRSVSSFVAAAQVMSVTSVWRDTMGKVETTLDLICHYCRAPLSNNAAFLTHGDTTVGFWYCMQCKRLLEGCSVCNVPVKGLAVVLPCGHRSHPNCWTDWAKENDECAAGCGEKI